MEVMYLNGKMHMINMDFKTALQKPGLKVKISVTLDRTIHKEFTKLMNKQYPKANLSSFFNKILIQGVKDLNEFKNMKIELNDKTSASEFLEETFKDKKDQEQSKK